VVNPSGHGDRPDYKVYRSRRSPLGSLSRSDQLERFRERTREPGKPPPRRRPPRERRPIGARRAVRWVLGAVAAWLALSFLLFMVSAQIEGGVTDDARNALSGNGNFLTGSTILVLGSDERKGESIDETPSGPGRADSIMLVHASLGRIRKLSIPRDSEASIPGHGTTKINAAYAIGGPALMIETVEAFLGNGVEVNHLIEVDFEDFPKFIDAMGGVTVDNETRICAPPFDNFWRGFDLGEGERKLNGRRALGFARVRSNPCAPGENDLARAERQQEVLSAIRRRLLAPTTFLRLPWVSWRGPQTIRTDLRGPGLLALAGDLATGGSGDTRVLEPSCLGCGVDSSLQVPEDEKASAVDERLGGARRGAGGRGVGRARRVGARAGGAVVLGRAGAPADGLLLAVVGRVEARALEVDGGRVEDLLDRRLADLAGGQRIVAHSLHHVEGVAVVAAVLVDRHGTLSIRVPTRSGGSALRPSGRVQVPQQRDAGGVPHDPCSQVAYGSERVGHGANLAASVDVNNGVPVAYPPSAPLTPAFVTG
jgi:LCP family protein required for cell wall assembly